MLLAEGVRRRYERHVSRATGHRRVHLLPHAAVRAAGHVSQSHHRLLSLPGAELIEARRARTVVRLPALRLRLVRVDGAHMDERVGGHAHDEEHSARVLVSHEPTFCAAVTGQFGDVTDNALLVNLFARANQCPRTSHDDVQLRAVGDWAPCIDALMVLTAIGR